MFSKAKNSMSAEWLVGWNVLQAAVWLQQLKQSGRRRVTTGEDIMKNI